MDASLERIIDEARAERAFPGAVLRVSERGRVIYERAFGTLDYEHDQPATTSTVYDLASLTKPLATVPALMRLIQAGRLSLTSALGELIDGYDWGEKDRVTVAQLLSHTSGLPAYRPYYQVLRDMPPEVRRPALHRFLVDEALEGSPGRAVCYSDIGFMILAWVIEAVTGRPLHQWVDQEVYQPLCIDELYYIMMPDTMGRTMRCAPTERCPWRNRLLRGEVHDDNAWVMGGEGGHAGLFGTVSGVDRLLTSFIRPDVGSSAVFDPALVKRFLCEWEHCGRALGFDMPSAEGSSSGRYFPKTGVGHLGFTGTSFWMDPDRGLAVILLTNRVHPVRDNPAIKRYRPLIHDAVMTCLT
ncbi:serine hydrolase domain-containing protein [Desulfatiferula olefinivorans]